MKWVVTVPDDVAEIFCTFLPITAAISLFMDACDQVPLIIPKMQDPKSLTLRLRSFSWCARERFACFFGNKDGQYYVYDSIWPVTPQITQDTRPTIVDAVLTLIFTMK